MDGLDIDLRGRGHGQEERENLFGTIRAAIAHRVLRFEGFAIFEGDTVDDISPINYP